MDRDAWFKGEDLAALGPERRKTAWTAAECRSAFKESPAVAGLEEGASRQSLLALLLLWNDHLDEAHRLVQDLPGRDAAFVHGIMHRREPDPGNARYWFHRVGAHPILPGLAAAVRPILAGDPELGRRLVRVGAWDPLAFIEAVDRAQTRGGAGRENPEAARLAELQRWEFLTLAGHLATA